MSPLLPLLLIVDVFLSGYEDSLFKVKIEYLIHELQTLRRLVRILTCEFRNVSNRFVDISNKLFFDGRTKIQNFLGTRSTLRIFEFTFRFDLLQEDLRLLIVFAC